VLAAFCLALLGAAWHCAAAGVQVGAVHGLWVWRAPALIETPRGAEVLRDYCSAQGINEVYIAVSEHGDMSGLDRLQHSIDVLHRSRIRVEALLSSENADESGPHRDKFLGHVREILRYNADHAQSRFDGMHLDIEPQQRAENKGPGNLRFLPGLADAYRAVRALAEPTGLSVNADIENKLLKGSLDQRRMLLSSMPRLTLMLYELSSPGDGDSVERRAAKLREASSKFLSMAYEGLHEPNLATMVVALRTPDYGAQLPMMLKTLDDSQSGNPHYSGWAQHSYNDTLQAER
jgi:hypothetical protein